MKKNKRVICLLMSFALLWNSAADFVNAEGVGYTDYITGENEQEILIEETEVVSEELEEKNVEIQSIKDLEIRTNNKEKSFELEWIVEGDYDACEIRVYKNADKTDSYPVIVEVQKEVEAVYDYATGEEYYVQKVKLNNQNTGTVCYFEVQPYCVTEDTKEWSISLEGAAILIDTPVLKVTGADAQCELKWNTVKGATGYEVIDADNGKVLDKVTTTSYQVNDLKNNQKYTYQVRAVAEFTEGEETLEFKSELSSKVSASTAIVVPEKVTGFAYEPYNLGAILTWNEVPEATAYDIYRYDTKVKKWENIKRVTELTYKDTGLTNGRKYYYNIKAVRTSGGKTVESAYAAKKLTVTAKKYLTGDIKTIIYYARVKNYAPIYETSTTKTVAKKLKAGTKVTIIKKSTTNTRYNIKLSDGKTYWIAASRIYFYDCKYSTLDYTTNAKEQFVNKKGYSSSTKYLIWISSYTQKTNIFVGSKGKWKLHKTFKCTTGKPTTRTPKGTFKINRKSSRYGNYTYEKYVSFWKDLNSFHSRLYRNGVIVDSRLGQPVSNGCIRLKTDEAKYIYDKMPKGTTVVSY